MNNIKKEIQLQRAIELRDRAQMEYIKEFKKQKYIFVELQNKNILQRIAKSIVKILEYKWELDKEKNTRKRIFAEFQKQTICDIIRKKGIWFINLKNFPKKGIEIPKQLY